MPPQGQPPSKHHETLRLPFTAFRRGRVCFTVLGLPRAAIGRFERRPASGQVLTFAAGCASRRRRSELECFQGPARIQGHTSCCSGQPGYSPRGAADRCRVTSPWSQGLAGVGYGSPLTSRRFARTGSVRRPCDQCLVAEQVPGPLRGCLLRPLGFFFFLFRRLFLCCGLDGRSVLRPRIRCRGRRDARLDDRIGGRP